MFVALVMVVLGCTSQPTNIARDGQGLDPTGSGGASNSPINGSQGGGSQAAATGGTEGSIINGPLDGTSGAGGVQPPIAVDDVSCTAGFPPQEDPAFQRVRVINDNHPEAQSVFQQMQLEEKLTIMAGIDNYDWFNGTAFEAAAVPGRGIPTFKMRDGPRGVRGVVNELSTTFPVAEARAASFDIELEERIGRVFAAEMRAMRVDLILAPTINVLRHPMWARAQETYGEDPVVLGELGTAFVKGVQGGPLGMPACPKHFAGNNTDENRGAAMDPSVNAIIDEQNLRENYTRAFQMIVERADPACIMAAYNKVNGFASAENPHLLTDILRTTPDSPQRGWDWKGFVLSDWEATEGAGRGDESLNAGLDIEMPSALAFGELSGANAANVDRAARRILNARATFGQLSPEYLRVRNTPIDTSVLSNETHKALTREAAEKGAVLLKNNGVLPLGTSIGGIGTPAVQSIVFLGPDADIPRERNANEAHGLGDGGSSQTFPPYRVSFVQGMMTRATGVTVTQSANVADAVGKTIAIIPVTMAHADEGEAYGGGGDRATMTLTTFEPQHWSGQKPTAFINAVRAADPNVKIVVLLAVGSAIIMEDWMQNADAIVQTFYPGQEGGNAVARLLYGDVNFSGKLPFTVATQESHYPVFGNTAPELTFEYLHGYRRFEANGTAPRFWFGYGLSYTTYEYGAPVVLCPGGITGSGRLNVEVSVTNTGMVAGDEIVQLYVTTPPIPGAIHPPPPKTLKAFTRVRLEPGQTKQVQLTVPARDLRGWGANGWELPRGQYTVHVGPSADPAALQSAPFTVN